MIAPTEITVTRQRSRELMNEAEQRRLMEQAKTPGTESTKMRDVISRRLEQIGALATRWLASYSILMLRVSLGITFLAFGVLKFFPDLSPAEEIATRTMETLTLGIIPAGLAIILVAAMESAIGLSLITGRHMRAGLGLLGVAMVGILSPLVLFPDELFRNLPYAPTLEGQYVFKDVVLFSAGLVVAAREGGGRMVVPDDEE